MPSRFKVQDLIDKFNYSEDFVRVLVIVSPTCKECVAGFETIKKIFEKFSSHKLRGFIIWLGMLDTDDEQSAEEMSEAFKDARVEQFWDCERIAGSIYGKTLHLRNGIAWDVYLLYSPRMKWENEEQAPEPVFWMHQLDRDSADPKLRLDFTRFSEETKFMLEAEDPDLSDKVVAQVLLDKEKKFSSH